MHTKIAAKHNIDRQCLQDSPSTRLVHALTLTLPCFQVVKKEGIVAKEGMTKDRAGEVGRR